MLVGKRELPRHFGRAIFIALHRCFRTSSLHLRLRKALARFPNFATLEHCPLSGNRFAGAVDVRRSLNSAHLVAKRQRLRARLTPPHCNHRACPAHRRARSHFLYNIPCHKNQLLISPSLQHLLNQPNWQTAASEQAVVEVLKGEF